MKTILVLAQHPALAEAIRSGLSGEAYRVIHRTGVVEAEPILQHGLAGVCILDVESLQVQGMWLLEKVRRIAPNCPVILYTGPGNWEWEEEAYLKGAVQVLAKPVRARLLETVLDRAFAKIPTPGMRPSGNSTTVFTRNADLSSTGSSSPGQVQGALHSLEVLRQFSAILTHTLNAEAMLNKFLLLLREIVGVNRAAVFLREPASAFGQLASLEDGRQLRKTCAIGLSPGLLEHFELSFQSGIGGHLYRSGRILRRNSEEARADMEIQQEFEVLGVQVAIPILDRETLIGVAVFDGRLTGEPLVNGELELIFHLLEELGLAVKNIWLHDQLVANHEMMVDTFRQLSTACVVISRDLVVLHANKAARNLLSRGSSRNATFEFSDLPQTLGTKVYQVLKTGAGLAPFRYQPEDLTNSVYNVSIVPFQGRDSALPGSALLMIDDLTQAEQFQKLEVEATNLRLVTTIADRLTHEIGNALVPLSTHQQLLKERYKDPEFKASLEVALSDGIKRITRLISQMRFLARDSALSSEAFPVEPLIQEAFQEAQRHQPVKLPNLIYENGVKPIIVRGDRAALKHALAEVLLNAIQANPNDPKISVRAHAEAPAKGAQGVQIEIQDNGAGFAPEAGQKIPTPFYTTRNVGLGLGLTVSRKIIETHHGKLEIVTAPDGHSGLVRITLPVSKDS